MIGLVILFIVVICTSAICSMAEAAILSISFIKARILVEENRSNAHALMYIKENINLAIASIVILNNAINIIGAIFAGQMVTVLFGNHWLGIASACLTFMIIVVAEIIPKTIGERYRVRLSLFFAPSLKALVWFMQPVVHLIVLLAGPFATRKRLPKITEDEIKMMLKLGRDAGTVEVDEEALCNRVFKLNDLRAFQMMKPIDRIYALPADKTLSEAREAIVNAPFSRIAVYDKNPRDIVGTAQHRVLLREIATDNHQAKVRDFMRPPIFVNHMIKADALLEKFQAYHQHLFVVQDDTGTDVGLITMEDVLEELFGEIYDEKDTGKEQR